AEVLDAFDSLFEEVADHANRWRTLKFNYLTNRTHDILEQTHLPRLTSLSIITLLNGRPLKLNTPILKRYNSATGDINLVSFEHPLPILTHISQLFTPGTAETLLQHLRRSQHVLAALTIQFLVLPGGRFSLCFEDGTEFSAETLGLSLPTLAEYTVALGPSHCWGWNFLNIAHMPHLRRLDIYLRGFKYSEPNNTLLFLPQLHTLNISAQYPRGFIAAVPPLLAATPNLEEVSLTQTSRGPPGYDAEWLLPLLYANQDPLTVAWPRLVVLRLRGMAIPGKVDLRRIPLGRPAFRRLSVDSTCWERSKGVGKDLNALREYFDVGVTEDTVTLW
ncbi:hypothetical protein M407DRAFT_24096, partial [Tulasnella calospora MUT 4182]